MAGKIGNKIFILSYCWYAYRNTHPPTHTNNQSDNVRCPIRYWVRKVRKVWEVWEVGEMGEMGEMGEVREIGEILKTSPNSFTFK